MRALSFFRQIPTGLSLNGPVLSISNISDVTINHEASTSFTATATATFPTQTPSNPAVENGTISYQWYIVGVGAITDGTYSDAVFSGTNTNTLSITNLTNPTANGLQVFLRATYTPVGYVNDIDIPSDESTPNAINGPFIDSNTATINVRPFISITTQPADQRVSANRQATFSVVAAITDNTLSSLTYQWQISTDSGVTWTNLVNSGTTIVGATSSELSISQENIGTSNIRVLVSHPTAGNSPLASNSVELEIIPSRSVLRYEIVGDNSQNNTLVISGDYNILPVSDGGSGVLRLDAQRNAPFENPSHVVYAPERDVKVKITLAGSRGGNGRNSLGGSGEPGGAGGVGVIYFIMKQQVEYVFKIGFTSDAGNLSNIVNPSGGYGGHRLVFGDGADGGGGTFFYERSRLLAVVGGGGGGGRYGRGGDGGGFTQSGTPAGTNTFSTNTAQGGPGIPYGDELQTSGSPINSDTSISRRAYGGILNDSIGRAGSCSLGSDQIRQYYNDCSDMTGVTLSTNIQSELWSRSDDGSNINSPDAALQAILDRLDVAGPNSRDSRIRPRWISVSVLPNTATTNRIVRGFKPGFGARNTGGWAYARREDNGQWQESAYDGGGGSGARGGASGGIIGKGSGGGGGGGFISELIPRSAWSNGGFNSGYGYVQIEHVTDEEWETRFPNNSYTTISI